MLDYEFARTESWFVVTLSLLFINIITAYVLADAGYDVWLGNSRGNSYGVKHVNMTAANPKFWDFS
jgi:hypothetical protein